MACIALNVSIIYSKNGDSQGAAIYFAMANELSPNCEQIYYNQAMACYQKNDKNGCLGHIQKLIALDPVSSECYLLMGQLKLDMGQYSEGLYYISRAGTLGASKTKDYYFTLFKLHYSTFIKLAEEYKQVLPQASSEDDFLQSMHKHLQETFVLMKENYSRMINIGVMKDEDSAAALRLLLQCENNMIELDTQLCEEYTIEELICTCLGEIALNDV